MSLRDFGLLDDGRMVREVTLKNDHISAQFLTLGARINGLTFDGTPGFTPTLNLEEATGSGRYCGAIVGPVMNRLGQARAPLDGRVLTFDANEGTSLLHSGDAGFHAKVWDIADHSPTSVTFALDLAPDAFPGHRRVEVAYRLDGGALVLEITATTDAPTLANIGFHPFWTLSGRGRDGHELQVHASRYLPMDAGNIPTGAALTVEKTPLDYRASTAPEPDIDHCFVLPPNSRMALAITLKSTQYQLDITTSAPAVHVYTGMDIGIAIEPEIHPDAPNHAHFPSIRLAPDETFQQRVIHRFSKR